MSTVAVCLRDTMWTLDIHTLWYGYIFFVVSGSKALITTSLIASFLSQSFHYCWVFVVSAALGGTRVTGAPKSRQLTTAEGILNCWVCTVGGGIPSSWAMHIWFCVTDFWTPASVYEISQPQPSLRRCFNDCDPLFSLIFLIIFFIICL